MQLHIIHPTMYINSDLGFNNGQKFSEFVNILLEKDVQIFCHNMWTGSYVHDTMQRTVLTMQEEYEILKDSRIDSFNTLKNGRVLIDVQPDNVSDSDWEILSKNVISAANLEAKIDKSKAQFFVGGVLEYCMLNIMGYVSKELHLACSYIPELSVSTNENPTLSIYLEKHNIHKVTYKSALQALQTKPFKIQIP